MTKQLFYFCVALLLSSLVGCTNSELEYSVPSERGEFSTRLNNFAKEQNELVAQFKSGTIDQETLELQYIMAFDNLVGGKISAALNMSWDSISDLSTFVDKNRIQGMIKVSVVPEGNDPTLGNDDYQIRIKSRIEQAIDSIRTNHTTEYGDIAEYAIYSNTIPYSFEELSNNKNMTEAEKLVLMRVKFRLECKQSSVSDFDNSKHNDINMSKSAACRNSSPDKNKQQYKDFCKRHFYVDIGICTAKLIGEEALAVASIIGSASITTATAVGFMLHSITDKGEFIQCYNSSVGSYDKCLNTGKYTYSLFWGLVPYTVEY